MVHIIWPKCICVAFMSQILGINITSQTIPSSMFKSKELSAVVVVVVVCTPQGIGPARFKWHIPAILPWPPHCFHLWCLNTIPMGACNAPVSMYSSMFTNFARRWHDFFNSIACAYMHWLPHVSLKSETLKNAVKFQLLRIDIFIIPSKLHKYDSTL